MHLTKDEQKTQCIMAQIILLQKIIKYMLFHLQLNNFCWCRNYIQILTLETESTMNNFDVTEQDYYIRAFAINIKKYSIKNYIN